MGIVSIVTLNKQDYENLLQVLETVDIKGLSSAKYFAILGHKIEAQIASYDDGDPLPLNKE